jgi:hypothetical protein
LRAAWHYLRGNESEALAGMRAVVAAHPAQEEGLMLLAEIAFLTKAGDAEARIERQFRRAPGLETSPMLKQETHRTTYAWLLMARGERARAATLLSESLDRAHAALKDGNEHQRVPFEIAAIHAARGERDAALAWLEKAPAAGYGDYSTLARHPIFERLRSDPRFQAVLATMERNIAAARQRLAVLAELRTMPFPETPAR